MLKKAFEDICRGVRVAFGDARWVTMIFLLAIADQFTKLLVVKEFELFENHAVIPGLFNLVYVQNRGAAFGIFSGLASPLREIVLLGATAVAMSVVLAFLGSYAGESRFGKLALALVCGGAIGNLIDRARLGYVVDFLDFHVGSYHWPAFNLADSYICVGVAILLLLHKPNTANADAGLPPEKR